MFRIVYRSAAPLWVKSPVVPAFNVGSERFGAESYKLFRARLALLFGSNPKPTTSFSAHIV